LGEAIHCQRAEKNCLEKLDIFFNELGGYFETRIRGQGSHNFEKKSGFEVIKSVASVLPVKPALRGKNGQFLAI
jgi:hypothetical protein